MTTPQLLRTAATAPVVIAHRGASTQAPENTWAAFEAAWHAGARWLETDVQPSNDGALILLHDSRVDRTTNGSGAVRDLSASQLSQLDAGGWFSDEFAGSSIPLLPELLARLPADRHILLELKGHHSAEDLENCMTHIRAAGRGSQVLLQSFELDVLGELRRQEPLEPVGVLVEVIDRDPVALCREFGAVTYNPDFRELLEQPEIVADLHTAGIATMPWTANDPHDWQQLADLGVDAIITDRPGELLQWCANRWPTAPGSARHGA